MHGVVVPAQREFHDRAMEARARMEASAKDCGTRSAKAAADRDDPIQGPVCDAHVTTFVEWLHQWAPRPFQDKTVSVARIKRVVADQYGVSVADIDSFRRPKKILIPRFMAIFMARKLTCRSLPDIAARFGGRDHTAIMHSVRRMEDIRDSHPEVAAQMIEIEQLILGRPAELIRKANIRPLSVELLHLFRSEGCNTIELAARFNMRESDVYNLMSCARNLEYLAKRPAGHCGHVMGAKAG